jgi:hypothetical protein
VAAEVTATVVKLEPALSSPEGRKALLAHFRADVFDGAKRLFVGAKARDKIWKSAKRGLPVTVYDDPKHGPVGFEVETV